MKFYFLFLSLFLCSINCHSAIWVVTTTNNVGSGSFRDIVANASSGDEITFASQINGIPIVLKSEITISKDLTIKGNGVSNTIFDGGGTNGLFYIDTLATEIEIIGVKFQNGGGYQHYPLNQQLRFGAVTVFMGGSLKIKSCHFVNNQTTATAYGFGSALSLTQVNTALNVEIADCYFSNNHSTIYGGSVWVDGVNNIKIVRSDFEDNTSINSSAQYGRGGAICLFGSNVFIYNCSFLGNSARNSGGAIYLQGGFMKLANSVLLANETDMCGGAVFIYQGGLSNSTELYNNTIANNVADIGGGFYGVGYPILKNNIFAKNISTNMIDSQIENHGDTFISGGNLISIAPNIINGNAVYSGVNLIGTAQQPIDPFFRDLNSNNVQLSLCSPAIDLGSNSNLPVDILDVDNDGNITENLDVDVALNVRIYNAIVDAGAFEYDKGGSLQINITEMLNNGAMWQGVHSLMADVLNGTGNYTYSWVRGGQIVSTTNEVMNLCNATYTLTVTDMNCNTSTTTDYIFNNMYHPACVATPEPLPISFSSSIYPNPTTTGEFRLTSSAKIVAYRIYDSHGNIIDKRDVTPSNVVELKLRKKMKGLYIIQVIAEEKQSFVHRLEVE